MVSAALATPLALNDVNKTAVVSNDCLFIGVRSCKKYFCGPPRPKNTRGVYPAIWLTESSAMRLAISRKDFLRLEGADRERRSGLKCSRDSWPCSSRKVAVGLAKRELFR